MAKLLTRLEINKKKKYQHKETKYKAKQIKESDRLYTIKFLIDPKTQLGERKTKSYKVATEEAERWVLSGNGYVSKIEWASPVGIKEINLDAISVAETRQSRISFRKHIKQKLPLKTFIYDV